MAEQVGAFEKRDSRPSSSDTEEELSRLVRQRDAAQLLILKFAELREKLKSAGQERAI